MRVSEETKPKPKNSRTKWILGSVLGLVVVLGVLYVAGYFVTGNRLPKDAAVAGIHLGGMNLVDAEETLKTELAPEREQAITLVGPQGATTQITPGEAGLSLDYDAMIQEAGGGVSWNPITIFENFFGGNSEVPPIVAVNEDELLSALEAKAPEFAVEPVSATLSIAEGTIERTDSTPGVELDAEESVTPITEAYRDAKAEVEAVVQINQPEVTTEMVDEAVSGFAEPLLSAPVVFTSGEGRMTIPVAKLAAAASFEVNDGALVGSLNTDELFEAIAEERKDLKLTGPKDASYRFSNGTPVVVPSSTGQVIDEPAFAEAVSTLILGADEAGRAAPVPRITEEPEFTTEAAEKVKPREVIGEFTTYYPHASYRNTNLGRAAEKVHGSVVMPGEIFSLDSTLGPRTRANGFVDGIVIDGGRLVESSGGGISQSATTMYNAAFFAGYEDIEHKPHSLYFDRYPAGREATIMRGAFDMRFRNNTEYPAIIQGYINRSSTGSRGSLTFKVWSIPTWDDVTSSEIKKSGFYSGRTIRIPYGQECEPQAPIQGFTATYSRLFWKDGNVAKRENYSWKYSAGDHIICEPRPEPASTSSDD